VFVVSWRRIFFDGDEDAFTAGECQGGVLSVF